MHYIDQLLFFFGAIGVFNSFIIGGYYLLTAKRENLPKIIFSLFLLVFSLRVAKSLLYSFSTVEPIFILQSGPAFFLLIGPLFYAYVISVQEARDGAIRAIRLHGLVWMCVIAFLLVVFPFSHYVATNKEIILPLINLQLLVYIMASLWRIRSVIFDFRRTTVLNKWLVLLSTNLLLLWAVFAFTTFRFFVVGSIIYSTLFYGCFFLLLNNRKLRFDLFQRAVPQDLTSTFTRGGELEEALITRITQHRLFADPDLKLPDLAEQMDLSLHDLSRFLNDDLKVNYPDFINSFRVEEAKRLLETDSVFTVEALGNHAGFRSKSAFYRAFRKCTGTTPARYQARGAKSDGG
ncbi:helix-turn-helix domain-containing protein [Neolewinella persica]|uniref:helix-turn-helix domain-containing protein n=1 Tax=Neolewinella persica TaxID=70998 RepID=UPI0003AA6D72|nr:AraC family transcriptional regulator [Neolewinella persica]